jgi:UPF0716 family protein affecting phage T7 exclusion
MPGDAMIMNKRTPWFLVVYGFVELSLFYWLAERNSLLFVILFVIVSALVGSAVFLRGLVRTLRGSSQGSLRGRVLRPSLDSLWELAAGVLLIVPGVLSDVVGLLLLTHFGQAIAYRWVGRFLPLDGPQRTANFGRQAGPGPHDDSRVIDVRSRPLQRP